MEIVEAVIEVEEIFDPETGKTTDNPFTDEIKYNTMTLVELRELCKEQGLPSSGNKADLIARLLDSDMALSSEEETAVEEKVAPSEDAVTETTENGDVSESGEEISADEEPVVEE